MGQTVILVAGRGPMARMPQEINNDDMLVRCVTNHSVDRIRGLNPDMVIVKDEFISEELHAELEFIKQHADTVIDLRLM